MRLCPWGTTILFLCFECQTSPRFRAASDCHPRRFIHSQCCLKHHSALCPCHIFICFRARSVLTIQKETSVLPPNNRRLHGLIYWSCVGSLSQQQTLGFWCSKALNASQAPLLSPALWRWDYSPKGDWTENCQPQHSLCHSRDSFPAEYYITASKAAQEKSTILQWSSWDSYETPKQEETPAEQTPTSQGQSCLVM